MDRELWKHLNLELDHEFTAKDALEVAGLTYRQLNEWEKKGVLGAGRDSSDGWRKFSSQQLFALLICATIRNDFGAPLESLRKLASYLLEPDSDHFDWAAITIADSGWTVYLLTDLDETFIMHGDLMLLDLLNKGFLRPADSPNYLLLHVNPLVNKVLEAAGQQTLEKSDDLYEDLRKHRSSTYQFPSTDITESERNLLWLVRSKPDQRISVHVTDGEIRRADVEREVAHVADGYTREQVLDALESESYQTLRIGKHNGRIVSLNQRIPRVLDGKAEKTRTQPIEDDTC